MMLERLFWSEWCFELIELNGAGIGLCMTNFGYLLKTHDSTSLPSILVKQKKNPLSRASLLGGRVEYLPLLITNVSFAVGDQSVRISTLSTYRNKIVANSGWQLALP